MEKSFILYASYYDILSGLNDEKLGKLLRALFLYNREEEVEKLPPDIQMAFSFIKRDMDANRLKYKETCERRRESANESLAKLRSWFFRSVVRLHASPQTAIRPFITTRGPVGPQQKEKTRQTALKRLSRQLFI